MTKQAIPGVKSGGGALPKAVTVLVLVAFVIFAIKQPVEAAHFVQSVTAGLGYATEALMTFFQTLN